MRRSLLCSAALAGTAVLALPGCRHEEIRESPAQVITAPQPQPAMVERRVIVEHEKPVVIERDKPTVIEHDRGNTFVERMTDGTIIERRPDGTTIERPR